MQEPLVSVLIPVYNHENYVCETIKSIINQTYKNIELIVMDDGSKDSSYQRINELKAECENRFNSTHIETKQNEGMCKTLNRMLDIAKGKYIYIIASDDIAKPQALEKEVFFLENNPDYSLVVGDNEIIDSNGKHCYWDKNRKIVYDLNKAKYKTFVEYLKSYNDNFNDNLFGTYKTIYRDNYIPNGYLIRKSIYDIIGHYPEKVVEDWWFMLQLSKYSKMKYLDEVLFSYRWHNSNTIKNSEKMNTLRKNTMIWEMHFSNNHDTSNFSLEILDVMKNGTIYTIHGIPKIFEIIKTRKNLEIIKRIKILNITIFEKKYKI